MSQAATARQYVLLRTLGEGSFGAVYLAQYESTGGFRRKVAVKLLHPGWNPDSDAGRRLRDEARLLGRIHHPNIVRVDDLTQLDGRWAVVMEHVPGRDLEAIVNHLAADGGRVPVRTALLIAIGIANALRAAWDLRDDGGLPMHVVHRDIKPSNVLLSDIGEVKVLDFGIARASFAGRESKTGEVKYGSLGYMPPERIVGENETISGDVYSLGVLVYELLVQESFGRSAIAEEAHQAQVERAMAKLAPACPSVQGELVPIVRRMLGADPDDRPELGELLARLTHLARHTEGPDLESWARAVVPTLPPAGDDVVEGSILAESNPRITTSSRTLIAADDEDDPSHLWEPTAALMTPAPPPSPRNPRVVFAAIGSFLVVVGLGAWWLVPDPGVPKVVAPAEVAPVPASPAVVGTTPPPFEPPSPPPAATPLAPTPVKAGTAPPEAVARPATPRPVPTPPVPASITAAAPRLRSIKVTLEGGTGLTVTCGDRAGSGAASVLLRDVPAGDCTILSGGTSQQVHVDQPRGIVCTSAGGSLTCR